MIVWKGSGEKRELLELEHERNNRSPGKKGAVFNKSQVTMKRVSKWRDSSGKM